jgi:hypothetical protein
LPGTAGLCWVSISVQYTMTAQPPLGDQCCRVSTEFLCAMAPAGRAANDYNKSWPLILALANVTALYKYPNTGREEARDSSLYVGSIPYFYLQITFGTRSKSACRLQHLRFARHQNHLAVLRQEFWDVNQLGGEKLPGQIATQTRFVVSFPDLVSLWGTHTAASGS